MPIKMRHGNLQIKGCTLYIFIDRCYSASSITTCCYNKLLWQSYNIIWCKRKGLAENDCTDNYPNSAKLKYTQ